MQPWTLLRIFLSRVESRSVAQIKHFRSPHLRRNRRLASTLVICFAVSICSFQINKNVSNASGVIWESTSPFDNYTATNVPAAYDIEFITAKKWASDVSNDYIYIYTYLRSPVTQYMFNDLQGSWFGLWIDTNKDGVDDIVMQINGLTFQPGLYGTPIYFRSRSDFGTGKCGASMFTDLANQVRWIGIKFQKSCAGMTDNVLITAQTEYIVDSDRFDLLSGWNLIIPSSSGSGATSTTTTSTTTTSTTTTLPRPAAPQPPTGILIQQVSGSAIRISWSDASSNEEGFILQRDDQVVPLNTPYGSWPMRTTANVTTFDLTGLDAGKRYCITVSAFNVGGNSNWVPWSCIDLASSVTPPDSTKSLTCNAARSKYTGKKVTLVISSDKSNAGKLLKFEIFQNASWKVLGNARLKANGTAVLSVPVSLVGKSSSAPIRATQGSRFICEGTLS